MNYLNYFVFSFCLLFGLNSLAQNTVKTKSGLFLEQVAFAEKLKGFKKSLEEFNVTYENYLTKLEGELKAKGELEQLLLVRKEKAEFRKGTQTGVTKYVKLQEMRSIYSKGRETRKNQIAKDLIPILNTHFVNLGEIRKALTKEDKIDEAIIVKKEEDRIKVLMGNPKMAVSTLGIFSDPFNAVAVTKAVMPKKSLLTNNSKLSPDNKEFLVGKKIGFPHNNDPTQLGYFSFQKDGKALWLGIGGQAIPREYKATGKPRQFSLWWPERKNQGNYQITVGPEGKTAEMVQFGIKGEIVKTTNGVIKETNVSEAPKVSVEDYLLKNKFVYFFYPDRSKTVTFLRKGIIGEGSNRVDHSWKIEKDELHFMNNGGEVTFSFRFDGIGKPLRQNSSPQLYKGRGAYLELIK